MTVSVHAADPGVARRSSLHLLLTAFLVIAAVFGSYELVERTLLRTSDPRLLYWLHLGRGVGTSLLVAVTLVFFLARHMRAPFDRRLSVHFHEAECGDDLRTETLWLVQLRWIACVGIGAAVLIGKVIVDLLPSTPRSALLSVAATMVAVNVLFATWSRRSREYRRMLRLQIAFDFTVLAALLHYTGGVESPILYFGVFHVILAGILLPRREAFVTGVLSAGIPTLVVGCEAAGWMRPHPIVGLHHDVPLLLGLAAVFVVVAYFTTKIVANLRRREAQLVQAGKMAAIGELSGALAHEINNPVAIIAGKVDLLLHGDEPPAEPARKELEKIARQVERIAGITHGLLAYSRPSPGRKEPTDLNRVVRETVDLVRSRARGQRVEIGEEEEEGLPPVTGNAGELSQIILNLANNALDAMPKGGRLRIRTARAPSDQRRIGLTGRADAAVVLEVADTGCGMAPEVRRKLFEPFFTTRAESGGTGLGLAICHGLVRSHGGSIEVESEAGRGSTFRVRLPSTGRDPREVRT